jgi:hypothetical protein
VQSEQQQQAAPGGNVSPIFALGMALGEMQNAVSAQQMADANETNANVTLENQITGYQYGPEGPMAQAQNSMNQAVTAFNSTTNTTQQQQDQNQITMAQTQYQSAQSGAQNAQSNAQALVQESQQQVSTDSTNMQQLTQLTSVGIQMSQTVTNILGRQVA